MIACEYLSFSFFRLPRVSIYERSVLASNPALRTKLSRNTLFPERVPVGKIIPVGDRGRYGF